MSKSKGNTVSPQLLIDQYGADTVRLFSIFAAPPEQSLEWSDSGVEGAYRFLKRLWALASTYAQALKSYHAELSKPGSFQLSAKEVSYRSTLHQILKQADYDMGRQQFNTVVSASMKMMNWITQKIDHLDHLPLLDESMSILLRMLYPIVPHITEYLWEMLGYDCPIEDVGWPSVDESALTKESLTFVIQVNGKRRGEIEISSGATEEDIRKHLLEDHRLEGWVSQKSIKKIIIVPKKLINLVV